MFIRFNYIITRLEALWKTFSNWEKVRKIIRSLLKEWDPKVTTIQEAKDLDSLSIDDFDWTSYMSHEIMMNRKDNEEKWDKNLLFKVSHSTSEEEEKEKENNYYKKTCHLRQILGLRWISIR